MSFPGIPALSELVDRQLAAMTGVDQNLRGRYQTLSEYTQYFWKTAQARDATYFKASVKDVVGDIVAVELGTTQFLTGAAHGIPATHYLNWQRSQGRPLTLDEVLIPSRKAEYVVAMREAHQRWLAANEDAQHDRAAYDRMWPFQETTNFALTRQGLVVKYDAYTIAPYSHGQPEILIPYERLRGVLRPEFIPAG
ncbi:lipoprotein [Bordetella pertussis]|nr:lipoprotein [Bordetella pertussis]CFW47575.1 lipoprotein [Bordetella pertussis]